MPAPDGQVDAYERVVNGKVIKVNAYAKKATTTTHAALDARKVPGRPRIAAQPGSYSSGRDLPGRPAIALPPAPPPPHIPPPR
jgi:hypothetical protein